MADDSLGLNDILNMAGAGAPQQPLNVSQTPAPQQPLNVSQTPAPVPPPPTLTNTPLAPALAGPAGAAALPPAAAPSAPGARDAKRSMLDTMTSSATPPAAPTPAAAPEEQSLALPASTAGDQGTADLESKIATPGNLALGAAADKAEQPKSFLDKLKGASRSFGQGVVGATGMEAFVPGSGATPMQKGAAIMNLLGKIGAVGSAATGSPEQKQQAIERQRNQATQQQALAQLQANQQYHQGMLGINQQKANAGDQALDIKQQQADTNAQKVVGAMNAKGYAQDPDGTWRPKTAQEILADPMLSQNMEMKHTAAAASKAKTDLDNAITAGKTNPDSLTQQNIVAALQQKKHQADAQLALAQAHFQQGENFHADSRQDKSFQFNQEQLEKIRTPVDQRATRMVTLKDSLAQGTPQADALIAPELLTAAAGGAGSGLRMNEAEISRIVGGRNQWQTLLAQAQAWQTDPTKGFALTPSQRVQVGQLIDVMSKRLDMKRQILDSSTQALADPQASVDDHRRILSDAHVALDKVDSLSDAVGAQPAQAGAGKKLQAQAGNVSHDQILQGITGPGGAHPIAYADGPQGRLIKMQAGGPWIPLAGNLAAGR